MFQARHLKFLVMVPLFLLGPRTEGQEGMRIALVVGVNRYDRLSPLKAAVNDAQNIAAHFQLSGYDQVWTLTDNAEQPTARASMVNFQIMLENIEKLAQTEAISELVVFFAGHGVQVQGENYLCFPEADLAGRRGIISVDRELIPWLRRVPSRLSLTFLDACREDLGPTRSAGVTRGLVLPANIGGESSRNILVAYSARPGEYAYEKPDGSGGFFTDVLLEALRKSEKINLGQLVQYLRSQLPQRTQQVFGKLQIPSFGGDFDLDASLTSTTRINRALLASLRFRSEIPVSAVYLNEEKIPIQPDGTVALNPGDYLLRAVSGNNFWEANISIKGTGAVTVLPDWKPAGTLDFHLPPAAALELTNTGSGTALLVERAGVVPYIEAGTWKVQTVGKAYLPWQGELVITPGQTTRLSPPLQPAPDQELTIRRAALAWERDRLESRIPEAARRRQESALVPWLAATGGISLTAAGAGLWVWSELAYAEYQAATNSFDAQSRRELVQALDIWKWVGLGLGAAGLAAWAGYEVAHPHPDRLQDAIRRLDEQLNALGPKEEP